MDENTLYACRDPHGVRPLSLGRLDRGWVVASETAALDIVGASFVRDIEPGELLAIDADGVRSTRFANPTPKGCVFEYVYLARPDSTIAGRSVHGARVEIGRRLARESPVDADLVIGVPESGTPAAVGYAQESGIPYGQGLMKNAYVGRTFIQPSQTIRQLGIRLKLNPLKEVIRGKRLIVVDDSIVRGNTQRALLRMLREAGAVEVHVRIASPPVKWPCFYGIDFPSPAELIANAVEDEDEMLEAVRHAIGADTLGYISLRSMVAATEQPASRLCSACFDGKYPIELPSETALGKNVIEHMLANAARGVELGDLAADEVPVDALTESTLGTSKTFDTGAERLPVAFIAMTDPGKSPGAAPGSQGITYASAGVDIEAGDRAVDLFKPLAAKATRPEVRRRAGRIRRIVRVARRLPRAGAGGLHRRRRYQAGGRAGDGQARHRRPRPSGDGGRRPCGLRRRAAVPAGLHRGRPDRAGAAERDRRRHRRGMRAGGLRAAGRRDRRTPRA